MCYWGSVAKGVLGIAGSVMSANAQADAMRSQANSAITSMNFSFQTYEMERHDAFDSAVEEIAKTRINAMQLNSKVAAAVSEEMSGGGRTADRILRSAQADEARTVSSIQDRYKQKSNEIDLNKESTLVSTKNYLSGLQSQMPSKTALALDAVSSGLEAYTSANKMKSDARAKGMKFDFWKGTY